MGASPTRVLYSATLSLSYRLISLNLITALYLYCDSYSQRYNGNYWNRTRERQRFFEKGFCEVTMNTNMNIKKIT
nr:MAG TPA: hypothetical protein [Caudoviricetes sp.]